MCKEFLNPTSLIKQVSKAKMSDTRAKLAWVLAVIFAALTVSSIGLLKIDPKETTINVLIITMALGVLILVSGVLFSFIMSFVKESRQYFHALTPVVHEKFYIAAGFLAANLIALAPTTTLITLWISLFLRALFITAGIALGLGAFYATTRKLYNIDNSTALAGMIIFWVVKAAGIFVLVYLAQKQFLGLY